MLKINCFAFSFFLFVCLHGQVKIGDNAQQISPNAVLELESTQRGFLPPRMNTQQRDSMLAPEEGLQIYNTDTRCMEYYRGQGEWYGLCPRPPVVQTTALLAVYGQNMSVEGAIVSEGSSTITDRGICWSLQPQPTLADCLAVAGLGSPSFVVHGGGLAYQTTYYVRAFATNSVGTSYGNELTVITTAGTLLAFTQTGTHNWQVPVGVTTVDVLVVGGGGGGAGNTGADTGGGGAGGLVFRPAYALPSSGLLTITVGAGGNQNTNGQSSTFVGLTALGGGTAATSANNQTNGMPGGSGGGAGRNDGVGGDGLQPSQPGESGAPYGFGNRGGTNTGHTGTEGMGGGGAGSPGVDGIGIEPADKRGGDGLYEATILGVTYNFSTLFGTTYGEILQGQAWFAGGGGGGGERGTYLDNFGGRGGGGRGGHLDAQVSTNGGNAMPNTGGGGGGSDNGNGGSGGSGIVLIKY